MGLFRKVGRALRKAYCCGGTMLFCGCGTGCRCTCPQCHCQGPRRRR